MLTAAQKKDVLKFIRRLESRWFTFRELVRYLDLDSDERRNLQHYLDELDEQGVIHRIKRGRYALPTKESLVSGVLIGHRDGYAFLRPDDRSVSSRDIFVPARNMAEALHGDRVLIKVTRKKRPRPAGRRGHRLEAGETEERLEGNVLRILERERTTIIGRYYQHPRFPAVAPLDTRMFQDVAIPPNQEKGAQNGQIVVVALSGTSGRSHQPQGRVIEVLGYPGDKDIEYRIVERKYGLPVRFSPETDEELKSIPDHVRDSEIRGRDDLRAQQAITIDGENARDFDDAVTLRKLSSGHYLLGVHIADVSHYVAENSSLDADAFARGNSVYFPDRAIPMLPPRLSSGVCSLKAGEERLVLSAILEINGHGHVVECRFSEGVIRSHARLTYTVVARILADRDPEECARWADFIPMLETMEELCLVLSKRRTWRGSLDFDLPEADMEFDKEGRVLSVVPAARNIAHRIIEEFMLLANEQVAQRLSSSGGPALYRVHEEPDSAKVREFAEFARTLGYHLEDHEGKYRPRDFQKFMSRLEGKPEARFMAYRMLRSFMQARYSAENLGHFGLAAREYTHFTSPIRRYPDLVVHRLLKECLKPHPSEAWQDTMRESLPAIAAHTSSRERIADDAEREIETIKKVQFMADKVGEEFEGIILSVLRQGFFVELVDPYVEGFVPLDTLMDDRYSYQERTQSFVGQRNRRHLKMGTRVVARLDHADLETFRLTFSIVAVPG